MRLRCFLRTIRGERPLREIARIANVNPGELSRIENGIALPKDKDIPALERAYSAEVVDWYPARVLLALEVDDDDLKELQRRLRSPLLARST